MSSSYYVLCLSHDPATTISGPHNDVDTPLDNVRERLGEGFSEHAECDLLIGKYSGALVEVCCPPAVTASHAHIRPRWVDADWLRLLLAVSVQINLDEEVLAGVRKFAAGCWPQSRLIRLRRELGVKVPTKL